jgi:hypothetical protein
MKFQGPGASREKMCRFEAKLDARIENFRKLYFSQPASFLDHVVNLHI